MQCFAMQAHFLSLPKEYKSCAVIITTNFIIWWPTLSMIFGQEEKLVIFARSSMAGEQKPWMARSRSSMNWCKCCKKNIYVSRFLDKSKPAVHSHRRKLWGVEVEGVPSVSRLINDLQVFLHLPQPLNPPLAYCLYQILHMASGSMQHNDERDSRSEV